MNFSEFISLAALIINLITLRIVYIQTKVTKQSFDVANENYKKDKQIREMSILPKMHFILHVRTKFNIWIDNLTCLKSELELIAKEENKKALKQISEQGLRTCEGLIDRFCYEKGPEWLAQVYVTGAQYYYNSMANLTNLWDDDMNTGNLFMLIHKDKSESLIDRLNESIFSIKELSRYINEAIPDVILSSPASISENRFLTKY